MMMQPVRLIGVLALILGGLLAIFPIFSIPVVRHLAFWEATFRVDQVWHTKILIGFWGYCIRKGIPNSGGKEWETKCSSPKLGFSLKLSDYVPNAAGELRSTQTAFFFWSLITLFISIASLIISLSPNFYRWKIASVVALVAAMNSFANFLAYTVIFTRLSTEARKTDEPRTIPLEIGIREDCFIPLAAAVFMSIGSGLLKGSYVQELRNYYRNLRSSHNEYEDEDEDGNRADGTERRENIVPKSILLNPNPRPEAEV